MDATVLPEMLVVPAGAFQMGRDYDGEGWNDELPVHTVHLDGYRVSRFPVTNAQYVAMLNWALARGYLSDADGAPYQGGVVHGFGQALADTEESSRYAQITFDGETFDVRRRAGHAGAVHSMADHPVVRVSWHGAAAYTVWLSEYDGVTPYYDVNTWTPRHPENNGYRLLTEAEWERAAAWDTEAALHWRYGISSHVIDIQRANYYQDEFANPLGLITHPYTSPVGWYNGRNPARLSRPETLTVDAASPTGAYDMAGNVWEWCYDFFVYDYYANSPEANPRGPESGRHRVLRGGSWSCRDQRCRSASRHGDFPTTRSCYWGFRLGRSGL